jgi:hypothetical protein
LRVSGRAPIEDRREVLSGLDRERAGDLRAGGAVDALRVLTPVDVRRRDELVVQGDREVLRGLERVAAERVVSAALGDVTRDRLEGLTALVREVERDDRFVADRRVEALLRVLDVRAREARTVLDHPPAVGIRIVRLGLLLTQQEHAGRDLDDLRVLLLVLGERVQGVLTRGEGRGRLPRERLLRRLVEDVEARLGRGHGLAARRIVGQRVRPRAGADLRALGGLLGRGEEAADRLPLVRVLVRIGLAVLVKEVGFPVVEKQLGRGAHLVCDRAGVGDTRDVDFNLVVTRLEKLSFGDTELVDALLHKVERARHGIWRDRLLSRWLRLIDELRAALEIQAKNRGLGSDHGYGAAQEDGYE